MACESSNTTIVAGVLLKSTRLPLLAFKFLISITSGVTAWEASISPAETKAAVLEDQLLVIKSMSKETSSITIPPHLTLSQYILNMLLMHFLKLLHH